MGEGHFDPRGQRVQAVFPAVVVKVPRAQVVQSSVRPRAAVPRGQMVGLAAPARHSCPGGQTWQDMDLGGGGRGEEVKRGGGGEERRGRGDLGKR